jgi:hypothetical protein
LDAGSPVRVVIVPPVAFEMSRGRVFVVRCDVRPHFGAAAPRCVFSRKLLSIVDMSFTLLETPFSLNTRGGIVSDALRKERPPVAIRVSQHEKT